MPIYGILCLRRKEATTMGSVRCTELRPRPPAVRALTSLTVDELARVVPL
jgi:hypothetical protein